MSTIRDIAVFQAACFAPVLPEDCQVNPQVYGAELAFWLCTELAKRGVATSYPNSEDWGWFIEYTLASGSEFAVHCGNVGGEKDRWMLSLRRHARKLFGRDKPPYEEARPVVEAIRQLLENTPEVQDLRWVYESEDAA
jgi:hypothetical protein